jgi:SAM-dependent methyltransferase
MVSNSPGAFYDGRPYAWVCERLLARMHARVAGEVPAGIRCLDVACGTGGLSFELAARCASVHGVDHSPRQIECARELLDERGLTNVTFDVADAADMRDVPDRSYDLATVSMALHEMPTDVRGRVLPELLRVAEAVLIVDFVVPMPVNGAGVRNRLIEFVAGPRHFGGFCDYTRRGGLQPLIEAANAHEERSRRLDQGTLQLVVIRGGTAPADRG